MSRRVLVIDDSPFIYKAVKRSVEAAGYEVVGHAQNGQEGLQLIEQLRPDFITLDVTMPVMDGLAVAANLRPEYTARVIMLSAMGDMDLLKRAQGYGIRHFLTKPFQPEDIQRLLHDIEGSVHCG